MICVSDGFYRLDQNYRKRNRGWNALWLLAGIAAVVILVIIALPFFDQANLPGNEQQLSQVAQNPEEYYGRAIQVDGQIEEIIGTRAFTMESQGVLQDDVLIISKSPLTPVGGGPDDFLYQADDRVSVAGTVRQFNKGELERELGVELVDEVFTTWEGRPVIIAETVQTEL